LQNKILTQNISKKFNFKTEDNVPADKFNASLKSLKKGVGSGAGSGSIIQRYG
jgi:hypothetical protein